MRRKILLLILIILCGFFIWEKSGFAVEYKINKAKVLYNSGKYNEAILSFKNILKFSPDNKTARYYYVLSLSKAEPVYSVQEQMYEMANSNIDDNAKQYAKSRLIIMRNELLEGVDGNYIYNAISGKDIVHWNIKSFPLKIYYENSETVPSYYIENIEKAFNQWSSRASFVKFTKTTDKANSNIIINFKDYTSSDCTSAGCHYTVAYTEPELAPNGVLKKMVLTFYRTDPKRNNFTPLGIYNSALHEIGHTLGIMGHSDNPSDVMYSNNDKTRDIFAIYRSESQYLTSQDIKTLALLYRLKPTITDVASKSENLYYPPLILGNNEEVLMKKIREWENYIQKYPNLPSGYINAATVYADIGDYENALRNLDLAQHLDSSPETTYTIEYNKAVIYYNKQEYNNALTHARNAKAIRSDSAINEMIEEINKLQKS